MTSDLGAPLAVLTPWVEVRPERGGNRFRAFSMSEDVRLGPVPDAYLNHLIDEFQAEQRSLTRRFVCADCGRKLALLPPRPVEGHPVCCDWEMVELPPSDYIVGGT